MIFRLLLSLFALTAILQSNGVQARLLAKRNIQVDYFDELGNVMRDSSQFSEDNSRRMENPLVADDWLQSKNKRESKPGDDSIFDYLPEVYDPETIRELNEQNSRPLTPFERNWMTGRDPSEKPVSKQRVDYEPFDMTYKGIEKPQFKILQKRSRARSMYKGNALSLTD